MEMPVQHSLEMGKILSVWWPEHNNRNVPGPKFRPAIFLGECFIEGARSWVVVYGTSQAQAFKETRNGADMMVPAISDISQDAVLSLPTRFDFNDIQAVPATTAYFSAKKNCTKFASVELPEELFPQAVECMKNANVARKLRCLGVR